MVICLGVTFVTSSEGSWEEQVPRGRKGEAMRSVGANTRRVSTCRYSRRPICNPTWTCTSVYASKGV